MPPVSIDFSALAGLIVQALVDGIRQVLSPLPSDFEVWLFTSIQGVLSYQGNENLLTHVPLKWTAQNADVLLLWRNGLLVEVGLGVVVLVVGGFRVVQKKDDLWYVVSRYGFFVIVGQTMAFWSVLVLSIVNEMADFAAGSPADIRQMNMPNDLVLGAMMIVALLFAGLAWIKGAVGVVFIDVLIVSAPYILTLSALPMMDGLAKWWVEEATTWCLRPFMVALVLRLGLGIGLIDTGGFQLLFAIVAFWIAYKMDTYLRRFSVGAWGHMANLGLFSRGAAMAAGAFGGGPAVAAPAAAAASATIQEVI